MNEFKKHKVSASEASKYTLSPEEIQKIINATKTQLEKIVIELLAYTGCRREELCLIRFKDIDLEHDRIMIPTIKLRENPYNHLREVPILNANLKRDLVSYMEITKTRYPFVGDEDKLIQSRKSPPGITPVAINFIVDRSAVRAGVKSPNPHRKHINPHMFRHTFVRYAIKSGLNFKVIQQLMGHRDISTTMNMYGEPSWDDKVAEMEKLKFNLS